MTSKSILEQKKEYLKKLAIEVGYTKVSMLVAPDKRVKDEDIIDDVTGLFEDILKIRKGESPSDRMGECFFTTEGK